MGAVTVGGVGALPVPAIRRAVGAVLHAEQREAAISVTFLGAAPMRRLNREHLDHDWPTDVLAFALPLPDGTVAGDIYVCRAVAAREARSRGIPVREELLRLVIHGTLHVLGYEHPDGAGRERSVMWRRQEALLGQLR